jgi:predicted DNA-binding protein (UPF0251 family)
MPRPRRFRNISQNPQIRCFKPEKESQNDLQPIEILIDEFEAIRLRDYHNIQQKRSAEIMGISQPTFHRTLNSARKKIANALINGNSLIIVGDGRLNYYECYECGFEWENSQYDKCPDCASSNIHLTEHQDSGELHKRRSYGGKGLGANPPKICKCPHCGYESPKTRMVPCSNTKCPECETPLCGSEQKL